MKRLELYGVQELNAKELTEIDGGKHYSSGCSYSGCDEPGSSNGNTLHGDVWWLLTRDLYIW